MMSKRKRQAASWLLIMFLLIFLTACSSKTSLDVEPQKSASATAAAKPAKTPKSSKSTKKAPQEVSGEAVKPPSESPIPEEPQPVIEAAPTAEPQVQVVALPESAPETQIADLNKTMYATRDLNVRAGDNKNTSLIGSLTTGQEVIVTGQSNSSGWYRIDYNGQAGFVSNKYLQIEKSNPQPVQPMEQQQALQQPAQGYFNTNSKPGSVQQILNSASLNPSKSGYEPLDAFLASLLSQLYNDSASTYEKVKVCYDYLIQNCNYGMNERIFDYIEDYFFGGYAEEVSAYGILLGHVGVCDDYSAAFTVMTRQIGLDCRVVGGQTSKAGGGYTGHAWCVITINGTEYIFDPQVEDNIAKGGAVQYYRFCKRYDEVPDKYILQ